MQQQQRYSGGHYQDPRAMMTMMAASPPGGNGAAPSSSVICQLCQRTFTKPVVLSCGHSFCAQCAEKWLAEHEGRCPRCERPAFNVIPNRALEELVAKSSRPRTTLPAPPAVTHQDVIRELQNRQMRERVQTFLPPTFPPAPKLIAAAAVVAAVDQTPPTHQPELKRSVPPPVAPKPQLERDEKIGWFRRSLRSKRPQTAAVRPIAHEAPATLTHQVQQKLTLEDTKLPTHNKKGLAARLFGKKSSKSSSRKDAAPDQTDQPSQAKIDEQKPICGISREEIRDKDAGYLIPRAHLDALPPPREDLIDSVSTIYSTTSSSTQLPLLNTSLTASLRFKDFPTSYLHRPYEATRQSPVSTSEAQQLLPSSRPVHHLPVPAAPTVLPNSPRPIQELGGGHFHGRGGHFERDASGTELLLGVVGSRAVGKTRLTYQLAREWSTVSRTSERTAFPGAVRALSEHERFGSNYRPSTFSYPFFKSLLLAIDGNRDDPKLVDLVDFECESKINDAIGEQVWRQADALIVVYNTGDAGSALQAATLLRRVAVIQREEQREIPLVVVGNEARQTNSTVGNSDSVAMVARAAAALQRPHLTASLESGFPYKKLIELIALETGLISAATSSPRTSSF